MDAELVQKHLKISNLATADATTMRLTRTMYLDKVFFIYKKSRCNL